MKLMIEYSYTLTTWPVKGQILDHRSQKFAEILWIEDFGLKYSNSHIFYVEKIWG